VARQHEVVERETDGTGRPRRADARRNHERLVAAARRVFAQEGTGASMEAIAREAGVGVGTLYRHFPKRIDLVEAVYRTDVENLVATAERAAADLEPWPAVVTFLEAFVPYAHGKRILLSELREAFEENPDLQVRSRERIDYAMDLVIGRAQRAGAMRTDVGGSELMQLVVPLCTNSALTEDQSGRLLAVILDGLRRQS